ncbi:MAG TPA: hypothetical protein VFK02_11770 [Kofleriaceae bacterium]|nr:hypothetical protein [Kofleriaceae bacterium]
MTKLLAVGFALPLLGCVVGPESSDDTAPGGTGSIDSAVHISGDTNAGLTYQVDKRTVVDAGATLTIPAGATVSFAPNTSIEVRGTVKVVGEKASPVHLSPASPGEHHYGFTVPAGGTLVMSYAVQVGGGITANGGTVTVTDSQMSQASGDFLVVGAGTVDVSYSAIGVEPGGTDTTHCDMHFGGTGLTVKVTHSNISTSSFGLMLYGGTNVDLTYNNWFSNSTQVDTAPGVSGDVSHGWFDKSIPKAGPGAMLTANNLSGTRLPSAATDPAGGAGVR